MNNKFKQFLMEFPEEFKIGISIALVIIILFITGNVIGLVTTAQEKIQEGVDSFNSQVQENQPEGSSVAPAPQTTLPPATTPPSTEAPAATPEATTQGAEQTTAAAPSTPATPSTPAEIIALFNESANKVKTNATTVVKNFEKRTVMEDQLIIPGGLEDLAQEMIAKHMSDDTEPITFATKEDIIANYPVPGETWVSQLTEAEVAEATCTDNGKEYEITLKLHPSSNPEPGNGVAKAFDTITSSEFMSNAPSIVTGFNTDYSDCVIKCKIDKATGNIIWANYISPLLLKISVKMIVALEGQVGLSFEKDYTISY